MTADTILHRLHKNGRNRPNAPAYYAKSNDVWIPTPWHEYLAEVRQAGRALIALGVEPGQVVTILGFNRPEWVIMDLAAMLIGGAAAGVYATNSPHECKYIIEHADSSVILLENDEQWQKIREIREDTTCLNYAVMMKGTEIDDPMALSWEAFMAKGNDIPEEVIDERLNSLQMDQLCTLIYTSGTTGPPKGVMLSHDNVAFTADEAQKLFDLNANDSVLSYLPLSHIAEQVFTIHAAITAGFQVYYAESGLKVAENLRDVQPTLVFGVPRVWERFYNGVSARLGEATGVRAKLIAWARGVGEQVTALHNRGQEPTGALALQYKLADRLVFAKLKDALGLSRVRVAVSGAAPIAKEILDFFGTLDIIIYEVYGQSEDTGPTTINRRGATKFGSVGQIYPHVEVKLAEDDEILVKGRNVFMGYYKDPVSTESDLQNGWLYSGDLGKFDEDGFLNIIGRKKEIIITSGGKNIAPKNIEAALKNVDLVSQAVVIGEQRRYLTALLTLDPDAAHHFAQANGLAGQTIHDNPKVLEHLQQEIDQKVNALFARVEHVRGFKVLPRDFTVEDGELTPTLKIKRRIVNQNFSDEIEALYEE
jgi:long-chain acyl-CoA synthetase